MAKRSLFGTSGIRGDAEKLFTDQFCFDLGRSFARFLDKHKSSGAVAIGMDPRGSSPRIKEGLESGLVYEGREILDEGSTPVPSMCYLLQTSDYYAGSLMVTGSHIKAYLNGVKFFAFKTEILKKHEEEFEEIYYKLKDQVKEKPSKHDLIISDEANVEYSEMLANISTGNYPEWRVVVDAGDGAQSGIMPQVLSRLGVNVIEMNTTIQGEFFARDTENYEDFKDLLERVPKEKADFGVAYDADGDRVVFVDRKGNFIPGDYTAGVIAKYSPGDTVVTPIATSQVVDYLGKKVIRTKVGSPFLVDAMNKSRTKFGFEANGGGISAEIMMTRDGGSTTIKLLNIMARTKKTLEELVGQLPKYYLVKTKVDYKWELEDTILKEAKNKFKGVKVEELDGLKIWIDKHTWILFRSSSNAPEFRVFAESDEEKVAQDLLKEGIGLVKEQIAK